MPDRAARQGSRKASCAWRPPAQRVPPKTPLTSRQFSTAKSSEKAATCQSRAAAAPRVTQCRAFATVLVAYRLRRSTGFSASPVLGPCHSRPLTRSRCLEESKPGLSPVASPRLDRGQARRALDCRIYAKGVHGKSDSSPLSQICRRHRLRGSPSGSSQQESGGLISMA